MVESARAVQQGSSDEALSKVARCLGGDAVMQKISMSQQSGFNNSNDPNVALTRVCRQNRKALSGKIAHLLSEAASGDEAMAEDVQSQIRELEEAYLCVAKAEAALAFRELAERGLVKRVVFKELELGISFVLARFELLDGEAPEDRASDSALSRRLVVVEKTYGNRGGGAGHEELCPTDELLGVALPAAPTRGEPRPEDYELVVDPSVEEFAHLLQRLRDAPRPIVLTFALGPQRLAARRAMIAADCKTAKKAEARKAEAQRRRDQRRKSARSATDDADGEDRVADAQEAATKENKKVAASGAREHEQATEEAERAAAERKKRARLREEAKQSRLKAEAETRRLAEVADANRRAAFDVEKQRLADEHAATRQRLADARLFLEEEKRAVRKAEAEARIREEAAERASREARTESEAARVAAHELAEAVLLREREAREVEAARVAAANAHMERVEAEAEKRVAEARAEAQEGAVNAHRKTVETERQQAALEAPTSAAEMTRDRSRLVAALVDDDRASESAADSRPRGGSQPLRRHTSVKVEALRRGDLRSRKHRKRSLPTSMSVTSILTPPRRTSAPELPTDKPLVLDQLRDPSPDDDATIAGPLNSTPPKPAYDATPLVYGQVSPLITLERDLEDLRARVEALETRASSLFSDDDNLKTALRHVRDRLENRRRLRDSGFADARLEHQIFALLADAKRRVDELEDELAAAAEGDDLRSVDDGRHFFSAALPSTSSAQALLVPSRAGLPGPPVGSPPLYQSARTPPRISVHESARTPPRISGVHSVSSSVSCGPSVLANSRSESPVRGLLGVEILSWEQEDDQLVPPAIDDSLSMPTPLFAATFRAHEVPPALALPPPLSKSTTSRGGPTPPYSGKSAPRSSRSPEHNSPPPNIEARQSMGFSRGSDSTELADSSLRDYDAPLQNPVDWRQDDVVRTEIELDEKRDEADVRARYEARVAELEEKRKHRLAVADAEEAANVAAAAKVAADERRRLEREAAGRASKRCEEATVKAELRERERLARERRALEEDKIKTDRAIALAMAEEERRDRIRCQRLAVDRAIAEAMASRLESSRIAIAAAEAERKDRDDRHFAALVKARAETKALRRAAVAFAVSVQDTEQEAAIGRVRDAALRDRIELLANRARDAKLAEAFAEAERDRRLGVASAARTQETRERALAKQAADRAYEAERTRQGTENEMAELEARAVHARARSDVARLAEAERKRRVDLLLTRPSMRPWKRTVIAEVTHRELLRGTRPALAVGANETKDAKIARLEAAEVRLESTAAKARLACFADKATETAACLAAVILERDAAVSAASPSEHDKKEAIEAEALRTARRELDETRAELRNALAELVARAGEVELREAAARRGAVASKQRGYDSELVSALRGELDEARYALTVAQKTAVAEMTVLRTKCLEMRRPSGSLDVEALARERDIMESAFATTKHEAALEAAQLRAELEEARTASTTVNPAVAQLEAMRTALDESRLAEAAAAAEAERSRQAAAELKTEIDRLSRGPNVPTATSLRAELARTSEARRELESRLEETSHLLEVARLEIAEVASDRDVRPTALQTEVTELRVKAETAPAVDGDGDVGACAERVARVDALEAEVAAMSQQHKLEAKAVTEQLASVQQVSAKEIARLRLELEEANCRGEKTPPQLDSADDADVLSALRTSSRRESASRLVADDESVDDDLKIGTELHAEVLRATSTLSDAKKQYDADVSRLRAELDEAQDLINEQKRLHCASDQQLVALLRIEVKSLREQLHQQSLKSPSVSFFSPSPPRNGPCASQDSVSTMNSRIDDHSMAATVNAAARAVGDAERRASISDRDARHHKDEVLALQAVLAATKRENLRALDHAKHQISQAREDLTLAHAKLLDANKSKDDESTLTEELIATKLELASAKMALDELCHKNSQQQSAAACSVATASAPAAAPTAKFRNTSVTGRKSRRS